MAKLKEFWIVGKNINYENTSWEFQGIYDSETEAEKRCEDINWWIALVRLNEFVPTEETEYEKARYPLETV